MTLSMAVEETDAHDGKYASSNRSTYTTDVYYYEVVSGCKTKHSFQTDLGVQHINLTFQDHFLLLSEIGEAVMLDDVIISVHVGDIDIHFGPTMGSMLFSNIHFLRLCS